MKPDLKTSTFIILSNTDLIFYLMLRLLLSIVLLSFVFYSNAQKANFQGKLFFNGQSVSGKHQIQFYIGPPLNWSSIPDSINVINGLYNTIIDFPPRMFTENISLREMVVILDGNQIVDTVNIYAPLERDPIALSYIRDSLKWDYIHQKPNVDTSYTNEIQLLSINGDTLAISNGNSVILPSNNAIYGQFKIVDTVLKNMVNIPVAGTNTCNGLNNQSIWQSFKVTRSAKLRNLILPISHSCSGNNVMIAIYSGQGNSGQSLGSKSFNISSSLIVDTLDLSSGVNSSSTGYITFIAGQVYTISISPANGCFVSVACINTDPYNNGISSIGINTDIAMSINVDYSEPSIFSVSSNGNIGMGLDSATSQLEVRGRIKDQTGFVMPVGTITAYSGRNIPEGWLLCDGRPISRTTYSDLFIAVDTSWGRGDGLSTFNLPDLRGVFLRGVDDSPTEGSSNRDPDKSTRMVSNSGGNAGIAVGSIQNDDFQSHSHSISWAAHYVGPPNGQFKISGGTDYTFSQNIISSRGGHETRPKNVYVYYIVKY